MHAPKAPACVAHARTHTIKYGQICIHILTARRRMMRKCVRKRAIQFIVCVRNAFDAVRSKTISMQQPTTRKPKQKKQHTVYCSMRVSACVVNTQKKRSPRFHSRSLKYLKEPTAPRCVRVCVFCRRPARARICAHASRGTHWGTPAAAYMHIVSVQPKPKN